ncbi:MAG TPA: TM2 domain-containing protein [Desulfobacteraceae bacterium]|nr:TM2 domain-containing protein [Desulfobacteraceae bacterium]
MSENDAPRLSTVYVLWIFGFTGAHRFYCGKPVSGTIYFFSLGIIGLGWLVDALLLPGLYRNAPPFHSEGWVSRPLAWKLLTFLGIFGAHRMYMEKWFTGVLYLLTLGGFGLGYLYDFWTLDKQIISANDFQWSGYLDRGGC